MVEAWWGKALKRISPRMHQPTVQAGPCTGSALSWGPSQAKALKQTLGTLGFNPLEGSFSGLSGPTHCHLLFQIFR